MNPTTFEAYTEEELAAVKEGAAVDAEGHTASPADAALGVGVFGTGDVYWHDVDAAEEVISRSDALCLDAETGALASAPSGGNLLE